MKNTYPDSNNIPQCTAPIFLGLYVFLGLIALGLLVYWLIVAR
jgi:hypothetical protein